MAAGPCGPEMVTGSAPNIFFFYVDSEGICQITVSFRSGAPAFVSDVPLAKPKDGCCLSVAYAQGDVTVPELAEMDASSHD